MNLEYQQKITKLITQPENKKKFVDIVQAGNWIVEAEYKRQAPYGQTNPITKVRGGELSRQIKTTKDSEGFTVTTTAKNKGYRYPIAIHQGTGRFRNASGDYPAGRMKDYSAKEILRFMGMAKRGFKFDIRPNKFAKRAKEYSEPKMLNFFNKELNKLINTY